MAGDEEYAQNVRVGEQRAAGGPRDEGGPPGFVDVHGEEQGGEAGEQHGEGVRPVVLRVRGDGAIHDEQQARQHARTRGRQAPPDRADDGYKRDEAERRQRAQDAFGLAEHREGP